jgi:protein-disulfide isomerase
MTMRIFTVLVALLLPAVAADSPGGKQLGNPSAPIRLELFSDFSCPGCKAFHENTLPALIRDFVNTGKAYIVFRDYVLPPNPGHVYSPVAARYAAAAARIGRYQQVGDALFATQSSWAMSGKVWESVAPALSADEQKRVQTLFNDPGIAAEIKNDTDTGNRAGLKRTPTMGVIFRNQHQMWDQFNNPGNDTLFFGYLRELLKK